MSLALDDLHMIDRTENLSGPLSPWQFCRPAPALGEQTDEVLREVRHAEPELAELRRDGVI